MPRLSVLLGTIVCAVVLFAACSEPPTKEIDQAQQAVNAARQAGAEQYAAEAFTAATAALQQAREAVDQRDYRLALSRAVDASDRAHEATTAATDNKAKARSQAEAAINTTNASVVHLQARVKVAEEVRVPARELSPARAALKDAEGTMQKARAQLAAGNYSAATAAMAVLDGQIRSEIRVIEAAITLRTARRPARKK